MSRTTALTPAIPGRTWDDTDHAIYDLRIRQRRSLRAVGAAVGLDHSNVLNRINKMMRKATFPEVDEMRTEEGHRLDELESDHHDQIVTIGDYLQSLIDQGVPVDIDTLLGIAEHNLKVRREIHAIARTRHQLFGLGASGNPDDADIDRVNDLIAAYLTGVADTQ